MSTLLIYAAGFFLFVAITLIIPGLKTLITPVWASLGRSVVVMVGWAWGWCIFIVKGLYSAHLEFARHFIYKQEDLDQRKRFK